MYRILEMNVGTKITRRWKESSTDAEKMGVGLDRVSSQQGRPAGTVQGRGWWGPLARQRCCGSDPPGRVWVTGREIAHYPHPLPFVKEPSRAMKAEHLSQSGCGAAVQCWDCSRSLKSEPCGTVGLRGSGIRHPAWGHPGPISQVSSKGVLHAENTEGWGPPR